jgi:hypothetical protein
MSGPEIFVPLTLFASTAIIAWKFIESRHQERMAMIDKGIAPSDFRRRRNYSNDPLPVLKWGLLGLFMGAGLLAGVWLVDILGFPDPTVLALALLTGGLALVIYYFIAARRYRDEVHLEL